MLKEQRRLQIMMDDKTNKIESQKAEIEILKVEIHLFKQLVDAFSFKKKLTFQRENKKLQVLSLVRDDDQDMDTPSSEENSPKSSFTNNFEKKQIVKIHYQNPVALAKRPPPPIPTQKPPIPSRAGIDQKLKTSNVDPRVKNVQHLTVVKQENDDSNHYKFDRKAAEIITPAGDEGFYSSQEDQQYSDQKSMYDSYLESLGLYSKCIVATPNLLPVNHRSVQKPKDVKFRSKFKAQTVSNLAALEEHQVTGNGLVTTVTYWTEPYL